MSVATLALGSWPRQGLVKVWAKYEAQESHFMLPRVQENVREWTLTFPSELPLWELDFQWTLESSKNDCRGQNPLDWKSPYIIGKLLELRCLKWAHMTHLDTYTQVITKRKGVNEFKEIFGIPLTFWDFLHFLTTLKVLYGEPR
jgi:hypothetical protein